MRIGVLLAVLALLASCSCRPPSTASVPEERPGPQEAAPPGAPGPAETETGGAGSAAQPQAVSAAEQPAEAQPQEASRPEAQPPKAQETAPSPSPPAPEPSAPTPGQNEPVKQVTAEEAQPEESFVVTQEVYNKTFDEVEQFIQKLNALIRARDYEAWVGSLSEEYIQRTSDPEYLQKQSQMPLLKKSGVKLESLRDYFDYVVVPSRSQVTLDDIEFSGEDRVKAISTVHGTRGILYLLVRQDGEWKVGVWD